MKSICVYCGSNFNGDPNLKKAIVDLAKTMVTQNITLIFGGGSVGAVSYTHLDVYKRQAIHLPSGQYFCRFFYIVLGIL